ncbi:MAG TPA: DUF4440 domain-containing protein [Paraburkholderia sp.]|jgi:ketosteroid isomerase-like protein|nr:DUF4440 domain-containing protein [Paraburkholderia sp.]
MNSGPSVSNLIRRCYTAYEAKDRQALEPLLSESFTFSSPRDDHISKATYFERCWPFSLNVDFFRIENGQIVEVQVYFGSPAVDVSPV